MATVVLALAVGSCGRGLSAGEPPAPGPPVWVEPVCPPGGGAPVIPPAGPQTRGAIPDDFVTVAVLRCRTETRSVPGQGNWNVLITERAETPATDLVEALRRPSDPRATSGACPLALVVPPYFVLIDASSRGILPEVPKNACGQPKVEDLRSMDSMPFRTVSETREGQVQSQKSIDTDCSDSYKDVIALGADTARAAPAKPLWSRPVDTLRVCVYDQISGGELPVGKLSSGRTMTADEARPLLTALDQAGPAVACTATHTRFAVLHSRADSATVELDGCRRLLRPDNTLGQLDESTTALIG